MIDSTDLRTIVDHSPVLTDEERSVLTGRDLSVFESIHLCHQLRQAEAATETLRKVREYVEWLLR